MTVNKSYSKCTTVMTERVLNILVVARHLTMTAKEDYKQQVY